MDADEINGINDQKKKKTTDEVRNDRSIGNQNAEQLCTPSFYNDDYDQHRETSQLRLPEHMKVRSLYFDRVVEIEQGQPEHE